MLMTREGISSSSINLQEREISIISGANKAIIVLDKYGVRESIYNLKPIFPENDDELVKDAYNTILMMPLDNVDVSVTKIRLAKRCLSQKDPSSLNEKERIILNYDEMTGAKESLAKLVRLKPPSERYLYGLTYYFNLIYDLLAKKLDPEKDYDPDFVKKDEFGFHISFDNKSEEEIATFIQQSGIANDQEAAILARYAWFQNIQQEIKGYLWQAESNYKEEEQKKPIIIKPVYSNIMPMRTLNISHDLGIINCCYNNYPWTFSYFPDDLTLTQDLGRGIFFKIGSYVYQVENLRSLNTLAQRCKD